jgi:hypothetical protein
MSVAQSSDKILYLSRSQTRATTISAENITRSNKTKPRKRILYLEVRRIEVVGRVRLHAITRLADDRLWLHRTTDIVTGQRRQEFAI